MARAFRRLSLKGLPAVPGPFVSSWGATPALRLMIKLQCCDLPAQGVAMNSQGLGRLGEVAIIVLQDLPDKPLFKLTDSILKKDVMFDQLIDESIELVLHPPTPILKVLFFRWMGFHGFPVVFNQFPSKLLKAGAKFPS